jgi:hypothetical protein
MQQIACNSLSVDMGFSSVCKYDKTCQKPCLYK